MQQINAQCIIDAGEDIHICTNQFGFDTTQLNPNIQNVIHPITVEWSYFYQIQGTNLTVHASNFLNDTSILNPSIIALEPFLTNITFLVFIMDSVGNVCADSVNLTYSIFNFFPDDFIAIQQGDTAQIYAIAESGFAPYSHTWTPNYNISDTTSSYVDVWPEETQQYQATVTDSFGCTYTLPVWTVQVLPTSIVNLTDNELNIYPNPTNGILNFEFENVLQNLTIKLFDLSGKLIIEEPIQNNTLNLNKISKGIYTLQLLDENKKVISFGKVQKN